MAEDEEAAAAAERLEAALNRIAKATSGGARGAVQSDSKIEAVAERLDALINELRSALEPSREEPS